MPATKIGKPNFAYSKKANFKPVCDNTPCTTKLFGEPISERLPPSVDANAIGINKRERTARLRRNTENNRNENGCRARVGQYARH